MISCVMPTYNQDKYLKRAIDSIIAQTYEDFELIVVNDGSTDNTQNILETYTDPRMRVFHKPNGGTGTALNLGFFYAKGEYETWFASDNVMYSHNFRTLLNALCDDIDFVYSNCEYSKNNNNNKQVYSKMFPNPLDYQKDAILTKAFFPGEFWLWKRGLRIRSMSSFLPMPCEDLDMLLRFSENGNFKYIPSINGIIYAGHEESLTTQIGDFRLSCDSAIRVSSCLRRGYIL